MNNNERVFIPQLDTKNKTYVVRIHYEHIIRKIIKSSTDTVTDFDSETVSQYLSLQK